MKLEEQVKGPRKRIGYYLPTREEQKLVIEYMEATGNYEKARELKRFAEHIEQGEQMKIEEQVKQILEEQLHVKVRGDYEELSDMGCDSLDLIELVDKLEEEFEIKIGDDDLSNTQTVRDVIRLVKEARKEWN